MHEVEIPLEQLLPVMEMQLKAGKNVRFSPMGVSMRPMLRQRRDSVVLSPVSGPLHKYDLPLYRRDNGQFVLHRIIKAGETCTCMGDNQFVPEPGIRQDQIIGVVTSFYREKKCYSVTDLRYRLYCRFWYHTRPLRHFWRRGIGKLRRILKLA